MVRAQVLALLPEPVEVVVVAVEAVVASRRPEQVPVEAAQRVVRPGSALAQQQPLPEEAVVVALQGRALEPARPRRAL
ncbi:MAG TPA: hypothetical protein VLL57_06695, partial [Candidatus Binataceae bacterium]|nr:hypothetical protein [Candidatus Binataceae bacterium]